MTVKYSEIWIVKLQNHTLKDDTYNTYILKANEDTYDVDLLNDFNFNTDYKISEIYEKIPIRRFKDVLAFCKKHIQFINPTRISKDGIRVGLSAHFLINHNLEGSRLC